MIKKLNLSSYLLIILIIIIVCIVILSVINSFKANNLSEPEIIKNNIDIIERTEVYKSKNKENVSLLMELASRYDDNFLFEKSKPIYLRILQLDPSNNEAKIKLANIFLQTREYEEAKKILLEILETEQSSTVFETLSLIYLIYDDIESSISFANNAMNLSPESKDYYNEFIELLNDYKINKEQSAPEAEKELIDFIIYDTFRISLLNKMLDNKDNTIADSYYYELAGQLEYKFNDIQKSELYFKKAYNIDNKNKLVLRSLLLIYTLTNRPDELQYILNGNEFIELSKKESEYYKKVITYLENNGESLGGIDLPKNDILNRYLLARLHEMNGETEEAEKMFNQFLSISLNNPTNHDYWYMLQRDVIIRLSNIWLGN